MSNNRWPSLADLKNSPAGKNNPHLFVKDKNHNKRVEKVSKEKEWLLLNLTYFCNERALTLETEYQFFEYRKWRSDFYIPGLSTIIEYEGLVSHKSRHTTLTGYTGDTEKYNKAAELGFKVIRVTALNYKTIIDTLIEIHYNKVIPF